MQVQIVLCAQADGSARAVFNAQRHISITTNISHGVLNQSLCPLLKVFTCIDSIPCPFTLSFESSCSCWGSETDRCRFYCCYTRVVILTDTGRKWFVPDTSVPAKTGQGAAAVKTVSRVAGVQDKSVGIMTIILDLIAITRDAWFLTVY